MGNEPKEIPLEGCIPAQRIAFSIEEGEPVLNGKVIASAVFDTSAAKTDLHQLSGALHILDAACGSLASLAKTEEFTGQEGKCLCTPVHHASGVAHAAILGLGKADAFDAKAAAVCGKSLAGSIESLITAPSDKVTIQWPIGASPAQLQSFLQAFLLQLSPDNRFKSGDNKKKVTPLKDVTINLAGGAKTEYQNAVKTAKTMAGAIKFVKEVVGAPANYVTTTTWSKLLVSKASEWGMEAKVLDKHDCAKLGMNCFLGVGKGSIHPPQFIHLTYRPSGGPAKKKIALIGKSIMFDSGGYNIKNAACQIELMKFDMGGAGTIFGVADAIGHLKPTGVEVHFIAAACENMVGPDAYRPGDILTASNGKTVEIGNTDAEGRLTLADALVYAETLKPDVIIDVATLTGAVVVALGEKYAGLWSTDDKLAEGLVACAKATGECIWHMPMVKEYKKEFESKFADMNNIGGKGLGGSIIAALFLKEFVADTHSWAHIDIAGTAWDRKESAATGYGVQLLTEYVLNAGK